MQAYTDRQMYSQTETDTDTDKIQTFNKTGRKANIYTNHTNRPERETGRQTNRQTNMQTYTDKQMYRQPETDTDTDKIQTYSRKGRKTYVHTNHANRPDRQTDKQADKHIDKHRQTWLLYDLQDGEKMRGLSQSVDI